MKAALNLGNTMQAVGCVLLFFSVTQFLDILHMQGLVFLDVLWFLLAFIFGLLLVTVGFCMNSADEDYLDA